VRNATKFFVKETEYRIQEPIICISKKEAIVVVLVVEALFESNSKFDAHCGWPSFDESIPGSTIHF
jgi:peptide methionine sulfoxide reductase MsrB